MRTGNLGRVCALNDGMTSAKLSFLVRLVFVCPPLRERDIGLEDGGGVYLAYGEPLSGVMLALPDTEIHMVAPRETCG